MTDNVIEFRDVAGIAHFTCKDCGIETTVFAPLDNDPRCAICRFIGENPSLPPEVVSRLRGTEK